MRIDQILLKHNQLIQIELYDEFGNAMRYNSRIENVEPREITIASPISKKIPLFLTPGTDLSIWLWDHVAIYKFDTMVTRTLMQEIPLTCVQYPLKIEKVQKRAYVRVHVSLNIGLIFSGEDDEILRITCKTKDISGGGMMLIHNEPLQLQINDEVRIEFCLNDQILTCKARVIWDDWELDAAGIERHNIGVRYMDITEKNRQKIVKYVFQRQIELRRKGFL